MGSGQTLTLSQLQAVRGPNQAMGSDDSEASPRCGQEGLPGGGGPGQRGWPAGVGMGLWGASWEAAALTLPEP